MYIHRGLASFAVLFGVTATASWAQSVVSAHSGTLHYFDGIVTIDGTRIESKVGKFAEVKENSVLRTEQGRAEILLTPGVFLRVGENTAVKMLDNRLMSTRVEVLSGSALVESDDPQVSVKNLPVTILYKDYEIHPVKFGVFEITSDPSQLKVFKGQASVSAGNDEVMVKEGRLMPFAAGMVSEKFDEKQADDLYLWARDRSGALSAANMSSARTLSNSGFTGGNGFGLSGYGMTGLGVGAYPGSGGWYYNGFLNMFTFMPYDGLFYSPFGYGFFSPGLIGAYYPAGGYYWSGGGAPRVGALTGVSLGNTPRNPLAAASAVSRVGTGMPAPNRSGLAAFSGAGNSGVQQLGSLRAPSANTGFGGAPAGASGGGFGSAARGGGMSGGGAAPAAHSAPAGHGR